MILSSSERICKLAPWLCLNCSSLTKSHHSSTFLFHSTSLFIFTSVCSGPCRVCAGSCYLFLRRLILRHCALRAFFVLMLDNPKLFLTIKIMVSYSHQTI
ncbi:hypothetical protein CROQUDRAFT_439494 [Cronartium quercuum f. sp. fusiforme G11]|uniref:Uncharacterized protein n=1 Tax=Cronartium quercuum f. sp. fusiforme G11 TaxID=708437 RepID=A0A9P6TDM7_9BASI|nr:hypothetical protein CROQUDRAFT_439494 [Cronartium quercuum f. sp. fusiforme G11]